MQHNVTQTECKRCGKCCSAGGPALHVEDRDLVVEGKLEPGDLVTFRQGEPAYDPVTKRVIILESELIKVRGRAKVGACKYYLPEGNACSIYAHRPLECRVLKCWNTRELEEILMKRLLSRGQLIPPHSTLWELIVEHDRLFDMRKLTGMFLVEKDGKLTQLQGFLRELEEKEGSFRSRVVADFGIDSAAMDFFFGRPVIEVLTPLLNR
ncbi:MAG: YkgJ family cysteine cluster protein [Thermodesulfobacteria bacterium]|nr:YkgJ family cysteine cluster protein [Thermodesulfobacteriota bacterium]